MNEPGLCGKSGFRPANWLRLVLALRCCSWPIRAIRDRQACPAAPHFKIAAGRCGTRADARGRKRATCPSPSSAAPGKLIDLPWLPALEVGCRIIRSCLVAPMKVAGEAQSTSSGIGWHRCLHGSPSYIPYCLPRPFRSLSERGQGTDQSCLRAAAGSDPASVNLDAAHSRLH